jgi:hypothetical protein
MIGAQLSQRFRSVVALKCWMKAAAMLALVLCLAFPAFAALTGDIEGTVFDPSGAVVTDAKVVIRSLATGVTRTATTNSQGQFVALQLDLGNYEIRVEKTGFRSLTVTTDVRSGEKSRVSLNLQVGGIGEVVNVEGGIAPALDVATSQVSMSIDPLAVTTLPNQGRDPVGFAVLAPGIVPVTKDNPFLGSGSFNSNGSRGRGNNITVDGVVSTDISTTGSAETGTFSLDGVQEFKLITNNYAAEFGRNSGSQVQIITKSGTNNFHGSAYWFHQNAALNARDYFDDTGKATPLIWNLWGFTFGGPVMKNKLFFFGHYEGLKIRGAGASSVATVPTPGDATGITDPAARALFTALGAPTSASGELVSAGPNATDQHSWSIRVDQVLGGGRDVLNYRYGENPGVQVSPGLTFIFSSLPNQGANVTFTDRQSTVGWTHTFSPTVVNQFRFAYGRSNPNFSPLSSLSRPFAPQTTITGYDGMGLWSGLPQGRTQNTFQWSDSVSWAVGRHSLKVGGDVFYYQATSIFDSNLRGTLTFASLAAFQAGQPNTYSQRFGTSLRHNVNKDFFWYGQDDIRLTNSFTINLGLRVERSGGVSEKDGLLSNIDRNKVEALGSLGTGAMGGVDLGGTVFRSNLNWAPRIGFSWNPMHGKMVVRAGYGWAYDYIFLNPVTNARFSPPFMPTVSLSGTSSFSAASGNTLAALLAGTAPIQTAAVSTIGIFPSTRANFGTFSPIDQHLKNPRNQQWNFGLQYEIRKDLVLKTSYVGAKTDFLQASVPINLISAAARPAPATSEADEIARLTQFSTAFSGESGGATTGSNRIDPRFNGVTQVQSAASSIYHSLQVDLIKRFQHGLSFGVNYTWAHSIDTASDVLGVLVNDQAGYQDPNIAANRGNSQFDIRHRIIGNYTWEVPWFKGAHGFVGKAFGGWGLSQIIEYHTGFPVTIFGGTRRGISDNTLLAGFAGVVRADGDPTGFVPVPAGHPGVANIPSRCARGVVTSGSASCPNTSGFPLTQPLLGNFGNGPRNALRLDKLFNTDFAVYKNTGLTEQVKLQFRWEIFNLTNTPNFSTFVNTLSSASFGQYQGTATNMRQMQGSIKVIF